MTDLEKILIDSLVTLIKDIDKLKLNIYKSMGITDYADAKFDDIEAKAINKMFNYIKNIDCFKDEYKEKLNDRLCRYIIKDRYNYKNAIELFEEIEGKRND